MKIIKENFKKNNYCFSLAQEKAHQRTVKIKILNTSIEYLAAIKLPEIYYLKSYVSTSHVQFNTVYLYDKKTKCEIAFKNSEITNCIDSPVNLSIKNAVNFFWNSPFILNNEYQGLFINPCQNLRMWLGLKSHQNVVDVNTETI